MSKFIRLVVVALAAIAGSTVFIPGVALASFGPDIEFTMTDSVTVGQTGLPASITLTNGSDGAEDGFTAIICNNGDNPPCLDPAGNPPDDDIGINLILSCGRFGTSTTCTTADIGVFRPSPTATGRAATECAGRIFDVVDYNPAFGSLRFTPQAAPPASPNIRLTDPGVGCVIDFTVDVIGYPAIDRAPATPGQQTGQLGDVLAYSDTTGQIPGEASDTRDITVNRAQPAIVTQASPTVALGAGTLTDTATVSGRAFPLAGATVNFKLYGPDDATCARPAIFDNTVPISPTDTNVTSQPYTPTAVGTYRWVASYSGDNNNRAVSGACNDANESVVATTSQPAIATTASPTIRLGAGQITDTANVSGVVGSLAGATVNFKLYGPNDATCANPAIFDDTKPYPAAGGPVVSGGYTPTATGTYRWVASYSGDVNNRPVAGACNDAGESVVVTKAAPKLTTDAGAGVGVGTPIKDTATVTGRVNAKASTIVFNLYGPNDDTCSGAVTFTSTVPLPAGTDTIMSAEFSPTAAGTYRWVATFSGDDNNDAVTGTCGDPAETVEVALGTPQVVTTASPSVPVNIGQLSDEATVTGRVSPLGGATIDFRLYGPADPTCAAAPVFESLGVGYPAAGGTVQSAVYTPTLPGTYRWVATYSGDANNVAAVGTCGDPAETVVVTDAPPPELPATGSSTGIMLGSGAGFVIAGLALLGVGRRRRFGLV